MARNDLDAKVLRDIEKKHGHVTPDAVVADAKSTRHPWHNRFTWDDKIAGHRYRIGQARDQIRIVRIQIVDEQVIHRGPAWVRDPTMPAATQGYVHVAQIRSTQTLASEAMLAEFERVAHALKRAAAVAGTLGLSSEIEAMIVSIDGLAARVASRRRPNPPQIAA
jgi:hypothetical protein